MSPWWSAAGPLEVTRRNGGEMSSSTSMTGLFFVDSICLMFKQWLSIHVFTPKHFLGYFIILHLLFYQEGDTVTVTCHPVCVCHYSNLLGQNSSNTNNQFEAVRIVHLDRAAPGPRSRWGHCWGQAGVREHLLSLRGYQISKSRNKTH